LQNQVWFLAAFGTDKETEMATVMFYIKRAVAAILSVVVIPIRLRITEAVRDGCSD
jgi:hypothetical protein